MAGFATLEEIDTHWTLTDLLDANEAMDIRDELEELARKRTK